MKLRPVTRVGLAVASIVAVLLAVAAPAFAHEVRKVGAYQLTVGWQHEPVYAGTENGVQVFVHDASGKPDRRPRQPGHVEGAGDLRLGQLSPFLALVAVVRLRHRPRHPRRVGRGHHARRSPATTRSTSPGRSTARRSTRSSRRRTRPSTRSRIRPRSSSRRRRRARRSRPRPSRGCRPPRLRPPLRRAPPRTPRRRPRPWPSSASSSRWCSAAWPSASPCRAGRAGPRPDGRPDRTRSRAHRVAGAAGCSVPGAATVVVVALALVDCGRAGRRARAAGRARRPDAGAVLQTSPSVVTVTFGEPPDPHLSRLRVLDSSGHDETKGSTETVPGQARSLQVHVVTLGRGVYTVAWTTVSAVDGHLASGTFAFGVRVAPSGAAATTGTTRHVVGAAVHARRSVAAVRRTRCCSSGRPRSAWAASSDRRAGAGPTCRSSAWCLAVVGALTIAMGEASAAHVPPRRAVELVVPHAARVPARTAADRRRCC